MASTNWTLTGTASWVWTLKWTVGWTLAVDTLCLAVMVGQVETKCNLADAMTKNGKLTSSMMCSLEIGLVIEVENLNDLLFLDSGCTESHKETNPLHSNRLIILLLQ